MNSFMLIDSNLSENYTCQSTLCQIVKNISDRPFIIEYPCWKPILILLNPFERFFFQSMVLLTLCYDIRFYGYL